MVRGEAMRRREVERQRDVAEQRELESARYWYAADVNLARRYWEEARSSRASSQ
jgi:hypothetical protein